MNLPKIILPPALSLCLLVVIIYGVGSCMGDIPAQYQVQRPWDAEAMPEREIVVTGSGAESPITIMLFGWGARFFQNDIELGTLKYERVHYALRDSRDVLIWKMISHDTYIVITDPIDTEIYRIIRHRDDISIVDGVGRVISSIVLSDDGASLFSHDGALLATASTTPSGTELRSPDGMTLFLASRPLSPAGLATAALPEFDAIKRAALIIMVK